MPSQFASRGSRATRRRPAAASPSSRSSCSSVRSSSSPLPMAARAARSSIGTIAASSLPRRHRTSRSPPRPALRVSSASFARLPGVHTLNAVPHLTPGPLTLHHTHGLASRERRPPGGSTPGSSNWTAPHHAGRATGPRSSCCVGVGHGQERAVDALSPGTADRGGASHAAGGLREAPGEPGDKKRPRASDRASRPKVARPRIESSGSTSTT